MYPKPEDPRTIRTSGRRPPSSTRLPKKTKTRRRFQKQIAETAEGTAKDAANFPRNGSNGRPAYSKTPRSFNWTLAPARPRPETDPRNFGKRLDHAKGPNPDTDEYRVLYPLGKDKITDLLEAVRHPKMTKGGLARSDSGNFVLTDIQFKLRNSAVDELVPLKIQSAQATYEQGPLKIAATLTTTRAPVGRSGRASPSTGTTPPSPKKPSSHPREPNWKSPSSSIPNTKPQPRTFQILGHRPTRALAQR